MAKMKDYAPKRKLCVIIDGDLREPSKSKLQ